MSVPGAFVKAQLLTSDILGTEHVEGNGELVASAVMSVSVRRHFRAVTVGVGG